jgi:hypothetical protein
MPVRVTLQAIPSEIPAKRIATVASQQPEILGMGREVRTGPESAKKSTGIRALGRGYVAPVCCDTAVLVPQPHY